MAQVLFWIFAVLAVIASIGVISLRNSVHSAVSLTGTLVCLAVLYILLGAEFVGVVQIIVYAGAIMVLFLFVITLLSPGKEETRDDPLARIRLPAAALGVLMVIALFGILATNTIGGQGGLISYNDLGTPATVGRELYTRFLFPFEVTSVLLLVAIVGALVLARRPVRRQ